MAWLDTQVDGNYKFVNGLVRDPTGTENFVPEIDVMGTETNDYKVKINYEWLPSSSVQRTLIVGTFDQPPSDYHITPHASVVLTLELYSAVNPVNVRVAPYLGGTVFPVRWQAMAGVHRGGRRYVLTGQAPLPDASLNLFGSHLVFNLPTLASYIHLDVENPYQVNDYYLTMFVTFTITFCSSITQWKVTLPQKQFKIQKTKSLPCLSSTLTSSCSSSFEHLSECSSASPL